MNERDYWVEVCDHCQCASCWHGELLCSRAGTAGTVRRLASSLRDELHENPYYFSTERLLEVCGRVEWAR